MPCRIAARSRAPRDADRRLRAARGDGLRRRRRRRALPVQRAPAEAPRLLVGRDTVLDGRDRVSDIRQADGTVIDAGPFAVESVSAPAGRVRVGYRRARLLRLAELEG